ncbi:MAG: GNAT family N-acetyltransferase [Clostridiaceae bacterium]|nr:GNAT family N-acetyltransferase [Clostridiaceae bacterium]
MMMDESVSLATLTEADLADCVRLWAQCCGSPGHLPYQRLDTAGFAARFILNPPGVSLVSLIARSGRELIGFASGCFRSDGQQAYITIVLVREDWRRRGVGSLLLDRLEQQLQAAGGGRIRQYEIMFFNPVNLTWIVPGTDHHDHPNAPGVDVSCDGYLFLKNRGYRDLAYQNAYYLSLDQYAVPPDMAARRELLAEQSIHITRYDATKHIGLNALFDDLGNEQWREIVTGNCAPNGIHDPVIIVEHENRVCGFTGPISVQPSGRGYFAGIGIHSAYRNRGAGKVLFSVLCMELKGIGTRFMTLFTGETNPARNIYEAAGFKIVKTWADMRKVVKGSENHD